MNSKFYPTKIMEENDDNIFSKVISGMKSVFNNPNRNKRKSSSDSPNAVETNIAVAAPDVTENNITSEDSVDTPLVIIESEATADDALEELPFDVNNGEIKDDKQEESDNVLVIAEFPEHTEAEETVIDELPDFVKYTVNPDSPHFEDANGDYADEDDPPQLIIEEQVEDVIDIENVEIAEVVVEECSDIAMEATVQEEEVVVNIVEEIATEESKEIKDVADEVKETPVKVRKNKNNQKKKIKKKIKAKESTDVNESNSEELVDANSKEDKSFKTPSKTGEKDVVVADESCSAKPRIVLTFRSEKSGLRSTNMKIVSDSDRSIEEPSIPVSSRRSLRSKATPPSDIINEDVKKDKKKKNISSEADMSNSELTPQKSGNSESDDSTKTPPSTRKNRRNLSSNRSDSNSEDSPPLNKERHNIKRSVRRRSKDFCENVLANAIARKEKSYSDAVSVGPTRLSRRIKPTAKVLANRELRLGFETQNNARLALQTEKTSPPEEAKVTRSRLKRSPEKSKPDSSKLLDRSIVKKQIKMYHSFEDKRMSSDDEKIDFVSHRRRFTIDEINLCILGSSHTETDTNKADRDEYNDNWEDATKSVLTDEEKECRRLNKLKKKHLRKLGLKAVVQRSRKKSHNMLDREVVTDESTMDSTNTEAIVEHFNTRSKSFDMSLITDPDKSDETDLQMEMPVAEIRELEECELSDSDKPIIPPPKAEPKKRKASLDPEPEHYHTRAAANKEIEDVDGSAVSQRVTRKRTRMGNSSSATEVFGSPSAGEGEGSVANEPVDSSEKIMTCLCTTDSNVYMDPSSTAEVEFCRAVDWVGGRTVGCGRVADAAGSLVRAGPRAPLLLPCDLHRRRLTLHHCCAGCGLFCTQGLFYQCSEGHLFHWECGLPFVPVLFPPPGGSELYGARPGCPHCGAMAASKLPANTACCRVNVDLKCRSPAILLPNPRLEWVPARMSLNSTSYKESLSRATPLESLLGGEGCAPMFPAALLPSLLAGAARATASRTVDYDDLIMGASEDKRDIVAAICDKDNSIERICTALDSGVDPRKPILEADGGSGLHVAAREFNLSAVQLFRSMGCELDSFDAKQRTPLMVAIISYDSRVKDTEAAKKSPKPDASDTPNIEDYKKDFFGVLNYLVQAGSNISIKGPEGVTALHLAAKNSDVAACSLLLESHVGAPTFINQRDDGGWTPLVWAAENANLHVVRYLLKKRADPMIRDSEKNVALHWAALAGCAGSVKALLEHGCCVSVANVHGDTPLHVSARQGNYNCVIILIARGGQIDAKNINGETPPDCVSDDTNCIAAFTMNLHVKNIVTSFNKQERMVSIDISNGKETNPVQCVNAVDDADIPGEFTYITDNCFTADINIDRKITSMETCKCTTMCGQAGSDCACSNVSVQTWYDSDGRLVPHFDYNDPPMIFECNDICSCNKNRCLNRGLGRGELWPALQVFRRGGCGARGGGWGVRTLRALPRGMLVSEYVGELLPAADAYKRNEDSYLFELDVKEDILEDVNETYCVDANNYGNVSRFINHKCEPNLVPVRVFVQHRDLRFPRIAFFSCRDVPAGEELGFDYGEKFWVVKSKSFTCNCASLVCRHSGDSSDAPASEINENTNTDI